MTWAQSAIAATECDTAETVDIDTDDGSAVRPPAADEAMEMDPDKEKEAGCEAATWTSVEPRGGRRVTVLIKEQQDGFDFRVGTAES